MIFSPPPKMISRSFSLLAKTLPFIDEVCARADSAQLEGALSRLWTHRLRKHDVVGIHGILFYEQEHKKPYYPGRCDEEARNPDRTPLR